MQVQGEDAHVSGSGWLSLGWELFSVQGGDRVGHFSDSFSVDMLEATSLGSLPEALERPGLDVPIQGSTTQREELNGIMF